MNPDTQDASQRGAAWLDANRPGWAQEIILRALEMEDDDYSIRGQLYDGEDESNTPWGNSPDSSTRVSYGLEPADSNYWPLQVAWFDRLAERGVEIPESYRDHEQWEKRNWQEIMIIDWAYYKDEGYLRCPDYFDTDPASWNEPVWRKAAYVARSDDDDEGYFEPISDHDMTVAEIEDGNAGSS
jgi:hypothetical protein